MGWLDQQPRKVPQRDPGSSAGEVVCVEIQEGVSGAISATAGGAEVRTQIKGSSSQVRCDAIHNVCRLLVLIEVEFFAADVIC